MTVNFGTVAVETALNHLVAVFGDAAPLVFPADYVTVDVLEEQERDALAIAELDELRSLERAIGEEHAVVAQDSHLISVDVSPAANQSRTIKRLEFQEFASRQPSGR